MIKFTVMSYNKARKHSYNPNIEDCIIISIRDYEEEARFNNHNPHIKGVLYLNYNDVEGHGEHCMTRRDAEKIIQFVNQHIGSVEHIVVHCEAGVSRSAGTCAGLMQILTSSDRDIFENPRFNPNMHCYKTMLNAYFGKHIFGQCIEEGVPDSMKENIEKWRLVT